MKSLLNLSKETLAQTYKEMKGIFEEKWDEYIKQATKIILEETMKAELWIRQIYCKIKITFIEQMKTTYRP